jgi:hypothetical protein
MITTPLEEIGNEKKMREMIFQRFADLGQTLDQSQSRQKQTRSWLDKGRPKARGDW